MLSRIKKFLSNPKNRPYIILIASLSLLVIITRISLWDAQFLDFDIFLDPWLNHIRTHSITSIGDSFHNYNSPYLYVLWLFSTIIPDNLSVIKLSALILDIILAIGVYKLVAHLRPTGPLKYLSPFIILLILPTAIINSAAWGQCDNILGIFAVFIIYFALKNRLLLAWLLIGLSFAFKMQGIFLAPFLLYLSIYRRKSYLTGPLVAIASTILISLPPLLTGHSPESIIFKFIAGTGPMYGVRHLTYNLPNLWQWFPNDFFSTGYTIGLILAILTLLTFISFGLKKRPRHLTPTHLLTLATLSALILPFVLPLMHDRYYYQAEILITILAIISPKTFLKPAIALQIISSITYLTSAGELITQPTHHLYRILSLIALTLISYLLSHLHSTPKKVKT
jgi:Gpi18-like mannosyltransferase